MSVIPHQMFYVRKSPAYIFITPEDVSTYIMSYRLFLLPFSFYVWIATVVTLLCVSIALAFLSNTTVTGQPVISQIIFTLAIFLEKYEPGIGIMGQNRQLRSRNILLVTFFLAAMVITCGYKGGLKSDFQVPASSKTEWKYFLELQNFSFYIIHSYTVSKLTENNCSVILARTKCYRYSEIVNSQECQFLDDVTFAHTSYDQDYSKTDGNYDHSRYGKIFDKVIFLRGIPQITYFLHPKCVEHFFRSYSTKVAIITTEDEFEFVWKFLSKRITQNPEFRIPLGHNKKASDENLSTPLYVFIPRGLNRYNQWL
ncbi:unnamed protein product, partial [Allacma fusca]